MDHLIVEMAQGLVDRSQAGTEEKGEIVPEGWAVRAEMDTDEFRQGLCELKLTQIGQQTPGPLVEDIGALFPSHVTGAPNQSAVSPQQAVERTPGTCRAGPVSRSANHVRA